MPPKDAVAFARAERERRAMERAKQNSKDRSNSAALTLQLCVRRWLTRRQWLNGLREQFDESVSNKQLQPCLNEREFLRTLLLFRQWYKPTSDHERLSQLSKAILTGLEAKEGQSLSKILRLRATSVMDQLTQFLCMCAQAIVQRRESGATPELRLLMLVLRPEAYSDAPRTDMTLACGELIRRLSPRASSTFADNVCQAINQMVMTSITVSARATASSSATLQLSALVMLVLLPFDSGASTYDAKSPPGFLELSHLLLNFLTIPLVIARISKDILRLILQRTNLLSQILFELSSAQFAKIISNAKPGNSTLFILGNLVDLFFARLDPPIPLPAADVRLNLVRAATSLLWQCRAYVARQASNLVSHHPLFEWYSGPSDPLHAHAFQGLVKQLSQLWSASVLFYLFGSSESSQQSTSSTLKPSKNQLATLKGIDLMHTTQLFLCMLETLPAVKREVLSALAYLPGLLPQLWRDLVQLGPSGQFSVFINAAEQPFAEPLIPALQLFCLAARQLFEVVDLQEMYEQQEPFRLDELTQMAQFLQLFLFRSLSANAKQETSDVDPTLWSLLGPISALLRILHERDEARPFCQPNTWIISATGSTGYKNALFRGEPGPSAVLRTQPSAIPFDVRLQLFHKTITPTANADERPRGVLIKLRRLTLLDDALDTFARLTKDQIQGIVRVQFVNHQGLTEAGIDQTGVFKEFLEESCKLLLHPSHRLFETTAEQLLFPASVRDGSKRDALALFELLGRLLAKAVREKIVLDMPLSSVFLAKLQRPRSPLSDLPQLDPELYKNLMFVKRYPGNVEDLALTFSVDEPVLQSDGSTKIVTRDLKPGGSAIAVTNDNRIAYVYLRADDRLNKQVAGPTKAFIQGFSLVMDEKWLRSFSAKELQRLVSGNDVDLDVEDLKQHCVYVGGYHAGHRVIQWLWQTVKEMDSNDQKAFLRYVTSCSKPPLTGFKSLNPPFTIRAVDNNTADHGDAAGPSVLGTISALLGVSTGADTDRLPSASTCFNLLKLPVYKSKKKLKERLLYAINSNAGFELS